MVFPKELILQEIRRTAQENGGRPLGSRGFKSETGIRYQDWFGKYWKSWGDAVIEAGFVPNTLQARMSDEYVLTNYSSLVRELGRLPVKGDLRLKKRADPSLPNEKVFDRFRSKTTLLARARRFWIANPECADLLPILPANVAGSTEADEATVRPVTPMGFVYLIRSGKFYKIGHTNSVDRREYELALQLPQEVKVLHRIETDDPEGIEAYWHHRFAQKRERGEWFSLAPAEIAAFKRRKFQ
jgi:hypothetical protein